MESPRLLAFGRAKGEGHAADEVGYRVSECRSVSQISHLAALSLVEGEDHATDNDDLVRLLQQRLDDVNLGRHLRRHSAEPSALHRAVQVPLKRPCQQSGEAVSS